MSGTSKDFIGLVNVIAFLSQTVVSVRSGEIMGIWLLMTRCRLELIRSNVN